MKTQPRSGLIEIDVKALGGKETPGRENQDDESTALEGINSLGQVEAR